ANLAAGAATAQAAIYARLTERLARAGADRVAVTSIGGHFCIEAFKPLSALPVIDIVDAVRDAVAARGARRVGLIGTRTVMESGFYGGLAPVETLAPPGALADAVHAAYVDMATSARVTAEQRAVFDEACAALLEAGADAVLLAGTDLALAYDAQTSDLPLIDGIAAHVAAILRA
ncbi:MAG: aspartate/glutamate racemase family protein, partial [Pseudomonadota bacterium]